MARATRTDEGDWVMSREQFEELFQPEPWMKRADSGYTYNRHESPLTNHHRAIDVEKINIRWRAYQARQPEIDELVEALEVALAAMNHMGDTLNGMGAVIDEDKPHFEAFNMCRALIAKHKGES